MHFKCGKCSKTLSVPDSAAGKIGKCPGCGSNIRIPRPAGVSKVPKKETGGVVHAAQLPAKGPLKSKGKTGRAVDSEEDPLLITIRDYKKNVEKAIMQRDEAMEMIDQMFQFFTKQANNPEFQEKERLYYRKIATQLFQLQSKFPLLLGLVELLDHCENRIFGKSNPA